MTDFLDIATRGRKNTAAPAKQISGMSGIFPDLVSASAGLIIFFVFYGPQLFINEALYLTSPIGDIASELASYYEYVHDEWRFPLFFMGNVNAPEGSNLLFAGGVPLLALIGKIIRTCTGQTINLFGPWYAICCVLQTHSLYFLMRQITDKHPLILAIASITGALSYAFLSRTGHVSLFSHFVCIYPIGLVIATTNGRYSAKHLLFVLAGFVYASMFIFAYFAIMNVVMFVAGAASLYHLKRINLKQFIAAGAAFFILLFALAYVGGYFWAVGRADPADPSGYRFYGFNLATLFKGDLLGKWWEGNFYLGLGVIAAWGILCLSGLGPILRSVRTNWPIAFMLSMLTLYSLSNEIHFLDYNIFWYPLPSFALPIVSMARTAGRLFWPIGYLLIGSALAISVARFPRLGPAIAISAVAIAAYESRPAYEFLNLLMTVQMQPTTLSYSGLTTLMASQRALYVVPTNSCIENPGANIPRLIAYQQLELISAKAGLTTNSSITARKIKDCERENREMRSLKPAELGAFFTLPALKAAYTEGPLLALDECRTFKINSEYAYLCSKGWSRDSPAPIPGLETLPTTIVGLER